jgi:folate-binding protein YgfZ
MDADLITRGEAVFAPLPQFALLSVSGADARAFLHGQLSNDVEHLAAGVARRAGYCSPKGRLLASLLVIPHAEGFMLQLSRDLAAPIAKRLTMYVLRSKVKVADAGEAWMQYGAWGRDAAALLRESGFEVPAQAMQVAACQNGLVVCVDGGRYLVIAPAQAGAALAARFAQVAPEWWTLADVRAGVPLVTLPTQDQFVPQMANFELIGGIDFKKGCYPGQEIVARSQYLGKLKRRMYRGQTDGEAPSAPVPGQDVFGSEPQAVGMIVNAAPRPEGGYEFLAVMQSAAAEEGGPIRIGAPDGPAVRIASLPYAV